MSLYLHWSVEEMGADALFTGRWSSLWSSLCGEEPVSHFAMYRESTAKRITYGEDTARVKAASRTFNP